MTALYISRAEDQGQSNLLAAATTTDGRTDRPSISPLVPPPLPPLRTIVYFAKVGKGTEREGSELVICFVCQIEGYISPY